MEYRKKICWFIALLSIVLSAHAMDTAISFSYGVGRPDNLKGYRASLELEPEQTKWKWLELYIDLNAAHWHADYRKNQNLDAIGVVPMFRIYPLGMSSIASPYIEGGVGVVGLSKSKIGHRKLGASWAFEDLIGGGIVFGKRHQFDVSLRYLHYSNASIQPPNQGIDVKALFTIAYRINSD